MDNKSGNSHSIETQLSPVPTSLSEEIVSVEESGNGCLFVNHGAIGWHVKRKEWVGDQSKKPRRVPREPIISWCTTYDDLLSTSQPFSQPIPLAEMVDFLVDIWHEGLNN